ncbi:MAG: amino acid ABC transporter substrate-binding protein [Neomegalonema sp.]|nr:amino acid ABC transporter substrate-binding protein [Neomegalonema sp.]
MRRISTLTAIVFAFLFAASAPAYADKLADIKAKGFVQCGVGGDLPGFSKQDKDGQWRGLDIDICRAVAAAVFGDAQAVKFTPLTAAERFEALRSGKVDILSRNTSWTMAHDTQRGVRFVGVSYYDGQGFLVPARLGVESAKGLSGARVCVLSSTTSELNVADFFAANAMILQKKTFKTAAEAVAAYEAGECDAYTTDRAGLAARRLGLKEPGAHVVLPEIISKEPLGPAVAAGDDRWFNVVRWTLMALINAEELGVFSTNIEELKKSRNPAIRRLLGLEGDFGAKLGLPKDWAAKAIAAVGHYGEIYDRNVGPASKLKLKRGVNALWSQGGVMYAPPIR